MTVIVVGANHRSVPLEVLERLTVSAEALPKVLATVARRDHVAETVVLSTCNRTEVYAVVDRFDDAYQALCDVFDGLQAFPETEISQWLEFHIDAAAARHLFSVAAGLDSTVIGDTDIQGQIRAAWEAARTENVTGPQLNTLFRHAVEVGKRARTETGISRSIASVPAAAVALAAERLGSLDGLHALVLGAGEMGGRTATALRAAGISEVLVANRTSGRAEDLAARVDGQVVALADLPEALVGVDVLITSTGATDLLVERAALAPVITSRGGRPLLIIDIAVPRDIDPTVATLPGVTLLDMDDLCHFVDAGIARRRAEVVAVDQIVDTEVTRYLARRSARSAAPLITGLREHAEAIRAAEVERLGGRLDSLDATERELVETLTRRIVAKMLHRPTVRLGELSGTVRGDRITEALVDLFDLDDLPTPTDPSTSD